ncbi:MAG: hypothetical protein QGI13_10835 [Rhodospirillales bacterium]|jgi:hypothetical protein|nr:hypothetical protein [Rhodospirillales bacterium]
MIWVRLGKMLMVLGGAVFFAATAWWYVFFEPMLGQDVKMASACFYRTTESCALGNLVGSLGDIPAYSPWAFWAAVAITAAGVVVYAVAPRRK